MCAACPEQKTKEQSTLQSKKNKQNNHGQVPASEKNNNQHVRPVTATSKEQQNNSSLMEKTTTINLACWAARKNQSVSWEVRLQGGETISQQASKH